eukprot:1483217-Pyramimonas_sp.AAC.1
MRIVREALMMPFNRWRNRFSPRFVCGRRVPRAPSPPLLAGCPTRAHSAVRTPRTLRCARS